MRLRHALPFAMMVCFAAAFAFAAPPPPPPKPPPVDCRDGNHQGIAFWIGEWDVSDTKSGATLARSTIEPLFDGCAIRETFRQTVGPGGAPIDYRGSSISAYNAVEKGWRQFYVDSAGAALSYTGQLADRKLVLTTHNGPVMNRMTVAAQPDATVRQTGEFSSDGGTTWSSGYDFTYRRHP